MCSIVKTSTLFLIVLFNVASGLPFANKAASETDNEFGGFEVKQYLTGTRPPPVNIENEEATLESRFGGPRHGRLRRHEEFGKLLWKLHQFRDMLHAHETTGPNIYFPVGNPHNFHPQNWHHNHGPPNAHHPLRVDNYGYDNPPFGHFPGNHHRFGDSNFNPFHPHGDFHPHPWDHPPHLPHGVNTDKPPNRRTDAAPDTNDTKPDKKNQDDNVTDVTPGNGQTTEKSTKYPDIDIRLGTRK